jgi:hypothetical protein
MTAALCIRILIRCSARTCCQYASAPNERRTLSPWSFREGFPSYLEQFRFRTWPAGRQRISTFPVNDYANPGGIGAGIYSGAQREPSGTSSVRRNPVSWRTSDLLGPEVWLPFDESFMHGVRQPWTDKASLRTIGVRLQSCQAPRSETPSRPQDEL